MISTLSLPVPVGSPLAQSRSASAALVRVALKQAWPSPWSWSAPLAPPQLFDFRWLTMVVKRARLLVARKDCASDGRLRLSSKRASTALVSRAKSPSGVTEAGL